MTMQTDAIPARGVIHPWAVSETAFRPERLKHLEALLALANGYMGLRAAHPFLPSATDRLQGFYVAGLFDAYPNPTMVTLKGRPARPLQMVNLPDFLCLDLKLDDETLDLATATIVAYERTLHLDRGVLSLAMTLRSAGGCAARIEVEQLLSLRRRHLAALRYRITPLDSGRRVTCVSAIEGRVANLTARHLGDLRCLAPAWEQSESPGRGGPHGVACRTLTTGIETVVLALEEGRGGEAGRIEADACPEAGVSRRILFSALPQGDTFTLVKYVAVATSRDADRSDVPLEDACRVLAEARAAGFDALLEEQAQAWREIWETVELEIVERGGAGALTQGLHYSLFQMFQNAPNRDHTVNIGAKGLTGEHYFGTYFWDTEIFMLPLFALTRPEVGRNLVRSRAHWLPGARRKAAEMGLRGAAFPFMSDANGDEACTLWQFGLMGVHINADIAWSVWFYYCVTGDLDLMADGGIDLMVETSRFWVSRAYRSPRTGRFVINRVLGPDEYHQAVDNHFYTNLMAQENLLKTVALLEILDRERPREAAAARERLRLDDAEVETFRTVADGLVLPRDEATGVNLQDERFNELEPHDLRADPPGGALPAVWSYDRILRTRLLRQADIVVAHLLAGPRFTPEQMRRDFDYYEPITTHDSSLSFCSHAIVAAALGRPDQALDYFLRTARLDLDDLHGNGWMGVHTACLGGAWQCVVFGFGGVRWYDGRLTLDPLLPAAWDRFSFSIAWHGRRLHATVHPEHVDLRAEGGEIALTLGQCEIVVDEAGVRIAHRTRRNQSASPCCK